MRAADYYRNVHDRTAAWYRSNSPESGTDERLLELGAEVRALSGHGAMLDIGCQHGALIRSVRDHFSIIHGIDIGDYSKWWKETPDVRFAIHDVDTAPLPFPERSFDAVTCVMVMEHVFDVFGLVAEVLRVLRPEGVFLLEVPNVGYFKHILSLLRGNVPRTGAQKFPFERAEGWDGQHLHYFTVKDLKQLLTSQGFEVLKIRSGGRFQSVRRIWPSMLFSSLIVVARRKVEA
jgi:SAM-dependent methyltransferase